MFNDTRELIMLIMSDGGLCMLPQIRAKIKSIWHNRPPSPWWLRLTEYELMLLTDMISILTTYKDDVFRTFIKPPIGHFWWWINRSIIRDSITLSIKIVKLLLYLGPSCYSLELFAKWVPLFTVYRQWRNVTTIVCLYDAATMNEYEFLAWLSLPVVVVQNV